MTTAYVSKLHLTIHGEKVSDAALESARNAASRDVEGTLLGLQDGRKTPEEVARAIWWHGRVPLLLAPSGPAPSNLPPYLQKTIDSHTRWHWSAGRIRNWMMEAPGRISCVVEYQGPPGKPDNIVYERQTYALMAKEGRWVLVQQERGSLTWHQP